MIGESFLWVRGGRWFWFSLVLCLFLSLLFVFDAPLGGAHGSTLYGYGTGIVAAMGIVFLMLFAWRKRAYASNFGTLREWLSAHVWIGLSLLLIVPLHAGFDVDWNIHTLLGMVTLLTILSGIWGVFLYIRLPFGIAAHRGGASFQAILKQCESIDRELDATGAGHSDTFLRLKQAGSVVVPHTIWDALSWRAPGEGALAQQLAALPSNEEQDGQHVIELAAKKRELVTQLVSDVRALAFLKGWLACHIPLAMFASALLVVHIWLVIFYP